MKEQEFEPNDDFIAAVLNNLTKKKRMPVSLTKETEFFVKSFGAKDERSIKSNFVFLSKNEQQPSGFQHKSDCNKFVNQNIQKETVGLQKFEKTSRFHAGSQGARSSGYNSKNSKSKDISHQAHKDTGASGYNSKNLKSKNIYHEGFNDARSLGFISENMKSKGVSNLHDVNMKKEGSDPGEVIFQNTGKESNCHPYIEPNTRNEYPDYEFPTNTDIKSSSNQYDFLLLDSESCDLAGNHSPIVHRTRNMPLNVRSDFHRKQCSDRVIKGQNFNSHKISHNIASNNDFYRNECSDRTIEYQNLQTEKISHNITSIEDFQCNECSDRVIESQNFESNKISHNIPSNNDFYRNKRSDRVIEGHNFDSDKISHNISSEEDFHRNKCSGRVIAGHNFESNKMSQNIASNNDFYRNECSDRVIKGQNFNSDKMSHNISSNEDNLVRKDAILPNLIIAENELGLLDESLMNISNISSDEDNLMHMMRKTSTCDHRNLVIFKLVSLKNKSSFIRSDLNSQKENDKNSLQNKKQYQDMNFPLKESIGGLKNSIALNAVDFNKSRFLYSHKISIKDHVLKHKNSKASDSYQKNEQTCVKRENHESEFGGDRKMVQNQENKGFEENLKNISINNSLDADSEVSSDIQLLSEFSDKITPSNFYEGILQKNTLLDTPCVSNGPEGCFKDITFDAKDSLQEPLLSDGLTTKGSFSEKDPNSQNNVKKIVVPENIFFMKPRIHKRLLKPSGIIPNLVTSNTPKSQTGDLFFGSGNFNGQSTSNNSQGLSEAIENGVLVLGETDLDCTQARLLSSDPDNIVFHSKKHTVLSKKKERFIEAHWMNKKSNDVSKGGVFRDMEKQSAGGNSNSGCWPKNIGSEYSQILDKQSEYNTETHSDGEIPKTSRILNETRNLTNMCDTNIKTHNSCDILNEARNLTNMCDSNIKTHNSCDILNETRNLTDQCDSGILCGKMALGYESDENISRRITRTIFKLVSTPKAESTVFLENRKALLPKDYNLNFELANESSEPDILEIQIKKQPKTVFEHNAASSGNISNDLRILKDHKNSKLEEFQPISDCSNIYENKSNYCGQTKSSINNLHSNDRYRTNHGIISDSNHFLNFSNTNSKRSKTDVIPDYSDYEENTDNVFVGSNQINSPLSVTNTSEENIDNIFDGSHQRNSPLSATNNGGSNPAGLKGHSGLQNTLEQRISPLSVTNNSGQNPAVLKGHHGSQNTLEQRISPLSVTKNSDQNPAGLKGHFGLQNTLEQRISPLSVTNISGQNPAGLKGHHGLQSTLKNSSKTTQIKDLPSIPKRCDMPLFILRRVFKLRNFRPGQREVIDAALSNKDVFVRMPTGGGKSLTYQLPGLASRGVTVVISPLIALIEDQVKNLLAKGIIALALSSNLCSLDRSLVLSCISRSNPICKFLFVTPEAIVSSEALRKCLRESQIARVVLDEAHCVSQWGHDFRPDYSTVGLSLRRLLSVNFLALTATAHPTVLKDVLNSLSMQNCVFISLPFDRPNLAYSVLQKSKDADAQICALIQANSGPGIVYCLSQREAELCSANLNSKYQIKSRFYHAGLSKKERATVVCEWLSNEVSVVCATIAFGMGIDRPNVRFVIHRTMSQSLSAYAQESGRAGRDGLPASCIVLYSYKDMLIIKKMASSSTQNTKRLGEKRLDLHPRNFMEQTQFRSGDQPYSNSFEQYPLNSHIHNLHSNNLHGHNLHGGIYTNNLHGDIYTNNLQSNNLHGNNWHENFSQYSQVQNLHSNVTRSVTVSEFAKMQLKEVIEYCEDRKTCRRKLLNAAIGERPPEKCTTKCDNCSRTGLRIKDCTIHAENIQRIITENSRKKRLTMKQAASLYIAQLKKSIKNKHSLDSDSDSQTISFRKNSKKEHVLLHRKYTKDNLELLSIKQAENIIKQMVIQGNLVEKNVRNRAGYTNTYIENGLKRIHKIEIHLDDDETY